MTDYQSFSHDSANLFVLLREVERYKKFINSQNKESCLDKGSIIKDDSLTMFGCEIFQFWLESIKVQNTEKSVFITFAKSISIPVRNYDVEPDGLSWLGKDIYAVWCEAVKKTD